MAGKIIDTNSELRAIVSLFDSPKPVANYLMAELNEGLLGYKPARVIQKRARRIFEKRGRLPSRKTAAADPALPKECVTILEKARKEPVKTVNDAKALIDQLKYQRKVRTFFEVSKDIAETIDSGKLDEDSFAELETRVDANILSARSSSEVKMLVVGKGGNKHADVVMKDVLFGKEKRLLKSGFKAFDDRTGGFARGNLVVVAATSGGGKSITGMQMGINQYLDHNLNVAVISLEMGDTEYSERLISNLAAIEYEAVRGQKLTIKQAKKGWDAYKKFKKHGKKNGCKFTVFPITAISPSELRARLVTGNYDVWIVDYLNLLNAEAITNNATEAKQLGEMARILKNTAEQLNIVVVALTQINDEGEVKYSKAIREHCNFLWKWTYDEDAKAAGSVRVIQDKARGGKTYPFQLLTDFDYMSVEARPINTEQEGSRVAEGPKDQTKDDIDGKRRDFHKKTHQEQRPARRMRGL
jgi:hypothetical protein